MRVGITGFGRIGRAITRANIGNKYFDLVAINDINLDQHNVAYLLKYDSVFGRLHDSVIAENGHLVIDVKYTDVQNISQYNILSNFTNSLLRI